MPSNSIFTYDNELPGVFTEIESQLSSEYDTSLFGTTDSIVVIGTAFDGPTGVITPVYSVEHAAYVFGKSYDATTRRETSLVTGIQDAWNNGCRTIYAMRINGIDMEKEFSFAIDCDYKLRVKSRYPSNLGKEVYIKYDNTDSAETFTIYKPASRATIAEKMAGLVESDTAVMVNEIRIGQDYGYTKDSKLVDVINLINNHQYNNVIELDIVDKDGNVVTSSTEAYEVTLAHMFPGTYFIGRDKSLCKTYTDLTLKLVMDNSDPKPYTGFDKGFYRVLNMNTDVASEYPIYYTDIKEMRTILEEVNITMDKQDDYLEIANLSDRAFHPDETDYEESDLTAFEKYQKLGEGFAITAVAERRVDGEGRELIPKVKEAALDDVNRIVPTGDGIYSILSDAKIRYHVLASDICADTVIGGKIPKYTEFKTTLPVEFNIFNGLIQVTPKLDSSDAYIPQKYGFMIYTKERPVITKDDIYTDRIVEQVGYAEEAEEITGKVNAKPGSICLLYGEEKQTATMYIANENGVYELVNDEKYGNDRLYIAGMNTYKGTYADGVLSFSLVGENSLTETGGKNYVVMQQDNELFITSLDNPLETPPFMATADVALDDESEDLFVYYQNHSNGVNYVMISNPYFSSMTMTDFVESLNESALGNLFEFALTQEGRILKDEYVTDADIQHNDGENPLVMKYGYYQQIEADRETGYDYSKHIPYYTTDNFARHLAQHCLYTELKTYPTHGVIGFERISDLSKTNLAKKVQEVNENDWSMYAKNNYGRNMLDANNMPYPIGRCVSACLFQSTTNTPSNYTTIVNGATAYAGFVSQLDIGQSSTGQTVDLTPMYEFSRSQLQTLSSAGIVTVRNSFTQGYVITDGVTMAPATDLLRRLFNTRVMHFVEDYIRAVCEPYIGKANSSANRNSLQTALTSKLDTLLDTLLRSYEFKIVDDGSADQYTYIDINYTIVPMNEIREIRNYLHVQN